MLKTTIKRAIFTSQQIYNWTPVQVDFEESAPDWMQPQITSDLSHVKMGELASVMANSELVKEHKLMHYRIRKTRVRAKGYVEIQRTYHVTNALIFLAKTLPDMDLVVSFHDHLDGVDLGIPIFVFAKDPTRASHILMPDFEALKGYRHVLRAVGRGNEKYPWEVKESRCMWRGGMTGGTFTFENFLEFPRSQVITTSLSEPKWVDACYTDTAQCVNPQEIQAHFSSYFAPYLPIEEQLKYKYQLAVDGNSCAYSKMYWGLFSNSLVLKQKSPNIQWYYRALQTGQHYLSVEKNLLDIIQWAREHDKEAKAIAEQSKDFAKQNLSFSRVMQYFHSLLKAYRIAN